MLALDYEFIHSKEKQDNILVILHGYGSNSSNFQSMLPSLYKLKNTSFVIPNAPFICDLHTSGYQWFPLTIKNDHYTISSVRDVLKANFILNSFIKYIKKTHNIDNNKISLFGFSQGGILSLCNGLYHRKEYNCVICHSGSFYAPNAIKLIEKFNYNQNILLIHGKADKVVPFSHIEKTQQYLVKNNIKYETFFKDNLEHNVDEETISATQNFILKNLH